jgi:hypothetical protein
LVRSIPTTITCGIVPNFTLASGDSLQLVPPSSLISKCVLGGLLATS